MKMISLLLLISVSTVHAATTKAKPRTKATAANTSTNTVPAPSSETPALPTGAPTNSVTAAPAATPMPWRVAYFGEYVGPRLSNFDLAKTQGPLDAANDYAGIDHGLKLGYRITGDVVLGTQIRANQPFAPTGLFTWRDVRFYASWAHMIDTSDVDMQGVIDFEIPTSAASHNRGQLLRLNIKNNWTFKTSLRNLSLSALTLISPRFFEVTRGKTDVYFAFSPTINYDFSPDLALLIEGNFDFEHNYDATFFDFLQSNPDSFNVGINYVVNSHVQINPALTFYTADFSVPTLYFALSAAL